jgi:hypothetical protein
LATQECVQARTTSQSCSLSTLPLIGENDSNITKDMIMDRVVVSHSWMGERFSQMLDVLDDDMKFLLGSVTTIVIDSNIRPSYYWTMTGAIYLDPRYLWLTPGEAKTIEVQDDFRSNYDQDLTFERFERYTKNNTRAYSTYGLDSNVNRTLDDIKLNFASLLYHELAHANDFIPSNMRSSLDKNKAIVFAINELNTNISTELNNVYPLASEDLTSMGQVMFQGATATIAQINTSAVDMGQLFEKDTAVSMYSYSTIYEDTANLFETFMMKHHYDVENDIAFLNKPTVINPTCNDYIIKWGERNSLAKSSVSERALFVVDKMLTDVDNWTSIANNFGTTISLPLETGLCAYLDQNVSSSDITRSISIPNNDFDINDYKLKY